MIWHKTWARLFNQPSQKVQSIFWFNDWFAWQSLLYQLLQRRITSPRWGKSTTEQYNNIWNPRAGTLKGHATQGLTKLILTTDPFAYEHEDEMRWSPGPDVRHAHSFILSTNCLATDYHINTWAVCDWTTTMSTFNTHYRPVMYTKSALINSVAAQ